jgi:translation elongation factor EF-Ts
MHRQQSEEAAALKASTQGKGREPTAAMMEKIIAGKVSKRLADICLLNQVSLLSFLASIS